MLCVNRAGTKKLTYRQFPPKIPYFNITYLILYHISGEIDRVIFEQKSEKDCTFCEKDCAFVKKTAYLIGIRGADNMREPHRYKKIDI